MNGKTNSKQLNSDIQLEDFSMTTNINSSTITIQPISPTTTTNNFTPLPRHRLVDHVYENETESIMFTRSYDDLLNANKTTIDEWTNKNTKK